jgi:superfamily II DNA/RNA helicase
VGAHVVKVGVKASAIHGDKSQGERMAALDAFKNGSVEVLVATDVAARGLDIAELPCVINYDLPYNAEDYVHRIGRTGRAGRTGQAVTFVEQAAGM